MKGHPLADFIVATLSPFTLFPVVLVVEHFGALVGELGVVQSLCETALAALAYTPPHECTDAGCADYTACGVNADMGAFAKVIPFLGQCLLGLLVEFGDGGRVTPRI